VGGEPLPPLKLKTTHAVFYCNGKLTESYLDSLSGMTSERSTGDRGAGWLTSSQVASPARIFPLQVEAQGWRANGRGSGRRWRGSYAKFNPDLRLWKIRQCSPGEDLTGCSWTWPKWGIMQDGVCSALTMLARPTSENESGYWPTPAARDWKDSGSTQGARKSPNLGTAVHWPTPCAMEPKKDLCRYLEILKKPRVERGGGHGMNLGTAVHWPTPTRSDYSGPGQSPKCQGGENLRTSVGGTLNPNWVEWLMGWPIGWTDSRPLETGRFRRWLNSHGTYCQKD